MEYRTLGSTGLRVGVIGLGCGGFDEIDSTASRELVTYALDHGMNYMDLYDANPKVRSNIGYGLGDRRAEMIIQGHIGCWWNGDSYERTRDVEKCKIGFEDLVERLHTDAQPVHKTLVCKHFKIIARQVFRIGLQRDLRRLEDAEFPLHLLEDAYQALRAEPARRPAAEIDRVADALGDAPGGLADVLEQRVPVRWDEVAAVRRRAEIAVFAARRADGDMYVYADRIQSAAPPFYIFTA